MHVSFHPPFTPRFARTPHSDKYLFNNCSAVGPLFGGMSTQINCVNKQQALQNGVGVIGTVIISLAALLALFLLADLHSIAKTYLPWLDFTAGENNRA